MTYEDSQAEVTGRKKPQHLDHLGDLCPLSHGRLGRIFHYSKNSTYLLPQEVISLSTFPARSTYFSSFVELLFFRVLSPAWETRRENKLDPIPPWTLKCPNNRMVLMNLQCFLLQQNQVPRKMLTESCSYWAMLCRKVPKSSSLQIMIGLMLLLPWTSKLLLRLNPTQFIPQLGFEKAAVIGQLRPTPSMEVLKKIHSSGLFQVSAWHFNTQA